MADETANTPTAAATTQRVRVFRILEFLLVK
jgi:hypothetical protein